jgi:predicted MFS family arabinose efflux permease
LIVTGARLGDRYGHRRMFLAGLAGFTLASLACGAAPGVAALIAARGVQGAAAALMVPQVLSLIQLTFTGAARARAIALYSMILAVGVALGQIVGGIVVTADLAGAGWRPAFLLNVPVGVALLVAGARLPVPANPAAAIHRIDRVGVLLLAAGMTAVVAPLALGRERGWPVWTWPTLAAGAAGLGLFLWYERRRASEPIVDLTVLRPAGVRPGLLACFAVMGAYAAFLFAITLHLQGGLGYTPLAAGLSFVPYATGFAAASLGASRVPRRIRAGLPVAGPLAFAAAAGALAVLAGDGWPRLASVPLLFVAGAGHAFGFSPLLTRIVGLVRPEQASALSALASTGALLAGVLSYATIGGVFLAVAGTGLTDSGAALRTVAVLDAVVLVAGAVGAARALRAGSRDPGSG